MFKLFIFTVVKTKLKNLALKKIMRGMPWSQFAL